MNETLAIEPKKKGGKGRHFEVALLSFITADRFWDGSARTAYRPIFVSFAETDQKVRAFTANLKTGRPATVRNSHGHDESKQLEVTRASGMKWLPRRLPSGITIMTGYMPALCDLDPGLMPERITFLFAPPTWWVELQLAHPTIAALPEKIQRETVLGSFFCAFADKRSPHPIVPDPLFHRRLYLAAKACRWFNAPSGSTYTPGSFWAYPEGGLPAGIEALALVDVSQSNFAELLREETARYFREESADWLRATEAEMVAEEPVVEHAPGAEPEAVGGEAEEPPPSVGGFPPEARAEAFRRGLMGGDGHGLHCPCVDCVEITALPSAAPSVPPDSEAAIPPPPPTRPAAQFSLFDLL